MTDGRQRVVFVLPTFIAGGAERVLITLMNGIDKTRFEPQLIVINNTGPLRDLVGADVPVHTLHKKKLRVALPALLKKLDALQPDIVVSTMAATNFLVLLSKVLLKKRARYIVREAVIPSSIIKRQKFPGVLKSAYKRLYPHADLVISPAQCIIDEFKDMLNIDTKNHVLLHNPVDTARLTGEWLINEEIPNRNKTVHFMASGRLHEQKGFDRLIEALPTMNHPYDWKLSILGAGAEHQNLQNLIDKHNLGNRVTLRGLVKSPWSLYGEADVFLLPSRWEGLPNVVLESLAVGTPVIVTKESGGIDEIAARAKGSVKVVSSMNEFIKEMEKVTPNPSTGYRPSLLPQDFLLPTVLARFESFLTGADTTSRP